MSGTDLGPRAEGAPFRIRERAVLRKFDGDSQEGVPVEVVLIEDGQVTGQWTGEDVVNAPQE